MRICSIDIGKVNFAYCIEEYDETKETEDGTLIHYENANLTEGSTKQNLTPVYVNMISHLDKQKELLDSCDYIVIEQQMAFGKRINPMALKIGQHCYSYFLMRYKNKHIIEFPSYYKTQALNAPPKMKYTERKKWAIEKATEILMNRGDLENLNLLTSAKKADDLADVLLQAVAFKICLAKKDTKTMNKLYYIN